jgi:hypothetical protein
VVRLDAGIEGMLELQALPVLQVDGAQQDHGFYGNIMILFHQPMSIMIPTPTVAMMAAMISPEWT